MKRSTLLLLGICYFCCCGFVQGQLDAQHEELGKVAWQRDYDTAIALAQKEQKDVLLLFQEVPGCAACRNYGKNVLSNPLLAEAIETLFVPLAIFNNKQGKDLEVLKKFGEPAWNNPVVRIIDHKGKNVVPRISGNYSARALYKAMKTALTSYGKPIPPYFDLLGQELASQGNRKEKYFSMFCFWSGEKHLAQLPGVLETEAGFMHHAEVVKVVYDTEVATESLLENEAAKHSIRPANYDTSYRKATNDVHYYLRHTPYAKIPLSPMQQSKINSALGSGKPGTSYLSPKQQAWLKLAAGSKEALPIHSKFEEAWATFENRYALH